MPKTRINLTVSSADSYFERLIARARAMDRGQVPAPGVTISFEDPEELLKVLSTERVRLLRSVKQNAQQISALAAGLKRDVRAVSRDVTLLEKAGLVRTSFASNPGHGKMKIVEPVAAEYKLVANL